MSAILFDTLQFSTRLKNVGFTEQQAEVMTEMQKEVISTTIEQVEHDYHLDDLATKRDLKELEIALKHDMQTLETNLKRDIEVLRADTARMIAESRADLTRWIIGAGFLQTALIIGVLLKIGHVI